MFRSSPANYLLYVVFALGLLWAYIAFVLCPRDDVQLGQSIALCVRQLDATSVLSFLGLWLSAVFLRAYRYQLLGRHGGSEVRLSTALRATLVGRMVTLITPTALIGGQPVSYYYLISDKVSRKCAGFILTMTTILDLAFFTLLFPIVAYFGIDRAQVGDAVVTFLWSAFAVGLVVLVGSCWLLRSRRYGYLAVRIGATMWSLLPFWRRRDLETVFDGWRETVAPFLSPSRLLSWNKLGLVACTAAMFWFHYLGIWIVLTRLGVQQTAVQSVASQMMVNFGTFMFSPGGGAVTGEWGFSQLLGQHLPAAKLYGMTFVFMVASYWLYVLVGFAAMHFGNRVGSILNISLTPRFLKQMRGAPNVEVELPGGTRITESVSADGVCTICVPSKKPLKLRVRAGHDVYPEKPEDEEPFEVRGAVKNLRIGDDPPPLIDERFSVRTILRAYLTGTIVRRCLRRALKKDRQPSSVVSPRIRRFLIVPERSTVAQSESVASNGAKIDANYWLQLCLNAGRHCGPRGQKTLARLLGGYAESRVFRHQLATRTGLQVPGILSLHLLSSCNLKCDGCNVSEPVNGNAAFDRNYFGAVLHEFRSMGGRAALLIGGEPMLAQRDLFALADDLPEVTLFVFSNGVPWTPATVDAIAKAGNVVPVLSVEGDEAMTDARRGDGVFDRVHRTQSSLARKGILHGMSVMLHRDNIDFIRDSDFLGDMFARPHHFSVFMPYTERDEFGEFGMVSAEQLKEFHQDLIEARHAGLPAVMLPHDEMQFLGGCGGGRVIMHVDDTGRIARCPYTYDDAIGSLLEIDLQESLENIQQTHPVAVTCLATHTSEVGIPARATSDQSDSDASKTPLVTIGTPDETSDDTAESDK